MSQDHEPNWGLLPSNPAAFFGLPPKFDLRELKSRYAEFVRQYKPEKAPDEFRRIRAAFEELKERFTSGTGVPPRPPFDSLPFPLDADSTVPKLRSTDEPAPHLTGPDRDSGDTTGSHPDQANPVEEGVSTDPPTSDDSHVQPLSENFTTTESKRAPDRDTPVDKFVRHWKRERKTPRDYYALAILSDFARRDSLGFGGWLLAGVQQYPKDRGLLLLLQAYFETERAAAEVEMLLVAASRSVPGDRFYFLTQPLWDRLMSNSRRASNCPASIKQMRGIRLLARDLASATLWRLSRLLLLDVRVARPLPILLLLLLMAWVGSTTDLFAALRAPHMSVVAGLCVAGLLHWLWGLGQISNITNTRLTFLHHRCYRWIWRRRILDFLRTDPIPVRRLADELSSLEGELIDGRRICGTQQIAEFLAHDVGLALFQIAQSFVSAREHSG